jgi:hypothetical protein
MFVKKCELACSGLADEVALPSPAPAWQPQGRPIRIPDETVVGFDKPFARLAAAVDEVMRHA